MNGASHDLQTLATRAGRGDAIALAELRQALEPQMVHIVRRAMRTAAHPSGLTGQIRATANNLCAAGRGSLADSHPSHLELRKRLISRVAERVCDTLLSRLGAGFSPGLPSRDTIHN